jgi:hypothetical protein
MASREDQRRQNRERQRRFRERRNADVTQRNADVTEGNAESRMSRHTDTDTDTDTDKPKEKVAAATGFEDFWSVYPKKVKKKKALEIWKRKRLHEKTDLLTKDVEFRIDHDDRWRDGYIPDPTTYLNGERWEDEVSKRVKKRTYADEIDDAVRKIAEREGENVNDQ